LGQKKNHAIFAYSRRKVKNPSQNGRKTTMDEKLSGKTGEDILSLLSERIFTTKESILLLKVVTLYLELKLIRGEN